jgi:hypothetical protein
MIFKFKKNAKDFCQMGTDDFWYSLFDGGYVETEGILADKKQLELVDQAVEVLRQFKDQLAAAGIYDSDM